MRTPSCREIGKNSDTVLRQGIDIMLSVLVRSFRHLVRGILEIGLPVDSPFQYDGLKLGSPPQAKQPSYGLISRPERMKRSMLLLACHVSK